MSPECLAAGLGVPRAAGVGLLCPETVTPGIPSTSPHLLANLRAVHSVFLFVSVKDLPKSRVPPEDRFRIKGVGAGECRMCRCTGRYGYRDRLVLGNEALEGLLLEQLRLSV